jgi:hypothetical protein
VVPEGFLVHRIFVGADALARGAAAAQRGLREFRDEHFDPTEHADAVTCPDGGCFTPYQSTSVLVDLLKVPKAPGAAVHAVHHFLAEKAKSALDSVGLTDQNVSQFVENVERLDAMVEVSAHPADIP